MKRDFLFAIYFLVPNTLILYSSDFSCKEQPYEAYDFVSLIGTNQREFVSCVCVIILKMFKICISTNKLICLKASSRRPFGNSCLLLNSTNGRNNEDLKGLFDNYLNDLKKQKGSAKELNDEYNEVDISPLRDNVNFDKETEITPESNFAEHIDFYEEDQFYLNQNDEDFLLQNQKFTTTKNRSTDEVKNIKVENVDKQNPDEIVVQGLGNIFEFLKETEETAKQKREEEFLQKQKLINLVRRQEKKGLSVKRNELYSLDFMNRNDRCRTIDNSHREFSKSKHDIANVAQILETELNTDKKNSINELDIILSLDPSNYQFNQLFQQNREIYDPFLRKLISSKLMKFSKNELLEAFGNRKEVKKSLKKQDYINAVMSNIWHLKTNPSQPTLDDSLIVTRFQIKTEFLKLVKEDAMINSKVFENAKKSRYAMAIKEVLGNPDFSDVIVIHSKNLLDHYELDKFKNYADFLNTEVIDVEKTKMLLANTCKSMKILNGLLSKSKNEIFDDFFNRLEQQDNCLLKRTNENKIVFTSENTNNFEQRLFDYIGLQVKNAEEKQNMDALKNMSLIKTEKTVASEDLLCDDGYSSERPLILKHSKVDLNESTLSKVILKALDFFKTTSEEETDKKTSPLLYDPKSIIIQHNLIAGSILEKETEVKFNTTTPYLSSKLSDLVINDIDSFKKYQNLNCNLAPFIEEEAIAAHSSGEKIGTDSLNLPNIEFIFDLKDHDDWSRESVELDSDSLMIVADLKKETSYLKTPFKEYDFKYLKEEYALLDKENALGSLEELKSAFAACNLKMLFKEEKVKLAGLPEIIEFKINFPVTLADGISTDMITVKYKMKGYQLLTTNHFSSHYDDIAVFSDTKILTSRNVDQNKRYVSIELSGEDENNNAVVLDRFEKAM